MENAGHAVAHWLSPRLELGPTARPTLFICGPGNNGGDGGVAARHLDGLGLPVTVAWLMPGTGLRGAARIEFEILERAGITTVRLPLNPAADLTPLQALCAQAGWFVDAFLGTGLSRPVAGPAEQVIRTMNDAGRPILAVDIPSGLDADTGSVLGTAVRATATITFVAPKVGFHSPEAKAHLGEVIVAPIGLPRSLLRAYLDSPTAPSEPTA
jgi:NAD(P)H-hydrate epimerase